MSHLAQMKLMAYFLSLLCLCYVQMALFKSQHYLMAQQRVLTLQSY